MREACKEEVGQILQFESEHSERQSYISYATHYRLTDYEYYETVRNSHISKVTTEYMERYKKWVETNQ
jgi:replication initiation and membrane attachment protein DnaB